MIMKLSAEATSHIVDILAKEGKNIDLFQRIYQVYRGNSHQTLWTKEHIYFLDLTQQDYDYLVGLVNHNIDNSTSFIQKIKSMNTLNQLRTKANKVSKVYRFLVQN